MWVQLWIVPEVCAHGSFSRCWSASVRPANVLLRFRGCEINQKRDRERERRRKRGRGNETGGRAGSRDALLLRAAVGHRA